jgi:host factor-I protein
MPPGADSATGPTVVQDAFLNHVRRERLTVTLHMMDGTEMEGRIRSFDREAVVLDHEGADYLIFKHAIAAVRTPRPAPTYPAPH